MYEDIREDISKEDLNYTYLSIISKKLNVGIVGGGKASYVKCKRFLENGCKVEVLSLDFIDEFYDLKNIKLIKGAYNKKFIKDKHLVIIATNDENINLEIKKNCEDEFKIYIFASDYIKGMAVTPMQRQLKNITFALNTKNGNPKGAVMLSDKVFDILNNYDDFMEYSSKIRDKAKLIEKNKKEIINFVCSEDFRYIYIKRKDKIVLELFFGKEIVKKIYKDL